jgi:hypothetical protein
MDAKPSHLKWLDNSYNEKMKAESIKQLRSIADQTGVDKIICPDDPSWSTAEILLKYYEMNIFYPPENLIVVVNSEEMYKVALKNGVKNCAVSYWTRPNPIYLSEHAWLHNLHFLGLLTIDELVLCEPPSCDTSMPIKLAIKGQTMEDWLAEGCPHINTKDLGLYGSDFFRSNLDPGTIKLARENILYLKDKVNNG